MLETDSLDIFGMGDTDLGALLLAVNLFVVLFILFVMADNWWQEAGLQGLPPDKAFHVFISHYQANSGDQCKCLAQMLRALGFAPQRPNVGQTAKLLDWSHLVKKEK